MSSCTIVTGTKAITRREIGLRETRRECLKRMPRPRLLRALMLRRLDPRSSQGFSSNKPPEPDDYYGSDNTELLNYSFLFAGFAAPVGRITTTST